MSVGGTTNARELEYLVLPDATNPWLLARVRWPDVYHAISPTEPAWRADPGLFDLRHDSCSVRVTAEDAAAIATRWGAQLPAEHEIPEAGPALLRRMPANWSTLSPAERRAWSLDLVSSRDRSERGSRAWMRRRPAPALTPADAGPAVVSITDARLDPEIEQVIDLRTLPAAEQVIDLRDDAVLEDALGGEGS